MEPSIYELVRQWVTTGELSESDKPILKAEYLRNIGAPADCKTCGNVWLDIRHHFFYKYKQLNNVANQIKKFIILTGGYLQLPGDNVIYVESGPENEGRKHFTDAVAQAIVDENPGYLGTLIGINPNYDQAATAQATSDDRDEQIKTLTIERDSAKAVADSKTEVVEKLTADRNTTLSDLESKTKELDSVKAELKSDRTKLTKANNEVTRLTAENVKMATELTALQEQLKQVTSTPVEPNPSANA